jgi:hypothetical protein
MDKQTALRLLKDLNLSVVIEDNEIREDDFLTILKNYINIEEA